MRDLRVLGTVLGWFALVGCSKHTAMAEAELSATGASGAGSDGTTLEATAHHGGRSGTGTGGADPAGDTGGSGTAEGGSGTGSETAGTGSGTAGSRNGAAGGGTITGTAGARNGAAGAGAGGNGSSAGAGANGNGAAGAGTGGATSTGGSRSAGCGLTGKPTGDLHLKVKDGAGVTRDYEVIVPASYNPATTVALTLVYHGAGGTSADGKVWGLQDAAGASSIFVYPQGVVYQTYGVGWDDSCGGYDMVFFDNMVASLEASYCIDPTLVYAAGFSWGCDQVTALACCRGDKIRAIGAASCTDEYKDPADYKSYQACPVANRAAVRFTHNTTGDSGYPAPLFATTVALFRSFNGCSATATASTPSPCRSFGGCRTSFVDCPYDNLGHAVPAGWGSDTWKFFTGLSQ